MSYTTISRCRICGGDALREIVRLGDQALTGVFPRSRAEEIEAGPMTLLKCDEAAGGCGLVQLKESYAPDQMYGENYGYRSGLNASMVRHLHGRVAHARSLVDLKPGDTVLDIGSNDSTTLRAYGTDLDLRLVGMDPTGVKFRQYYPDHVRLIPDFFSGATFKKTFGEAARAKIVTSFAMFYDLDDPIAFMRDVASILADDGVWVFEQSYCPAMVKANAYDTICHEHISYYALKQIKWMTDAAGLKIVDVEMNDVNGGSFAIAAAKKTSPRPEAARLVDDLLRQEREAGYSTMRPFEAFAASMREHRDALKVFVADALAKGKSIYGYGASTKGNVVLQYCGFTDREIKAVAEVNEDKFGRFTPGSKIPILSEAEVRAKKPDYLLVLPWHFREGIVRREQAYLESGGKLVFPLPRLEIVGAGGEVTAWEAPGRKVEVEVFATGGKVGAR